MTRKQKNILLLLASKKGYRTEFDQIVFLNKFFNGDINFYEKKISSLLDDKSKNYWRNEERKAIRNAISLLKKDIQKVRKDRPNDNLMISASEIANFQFCPVSFSIQRTFEIEKDFNMEMGDFLHDTLNFKNGDLKKNWKSLFLKKVDQLPKVYKNKPVYFGHLKNSKSFINSELNISCKPDFIFEDKIKREKYVIEEKYSNKVYTSEFYLNQKIQLMAYLLTFPEAEYGYVITWRYYSDERNNLRLLLSNDKERIEDFRLEKDDSFLKKCLLTLISQMRKMILKGRLRYPIKYSSLKCAKCSVAEYCSHKSSKSNEIIFPYF